MHLEHIHPYSSTEYRTEASQYKYLATLPSFRHVVVRACDKEGTIFYIKKYADDEAFLNESKLIGIIGCSSQPFVVPEIVESLPEKKINILTEVKGDPIDVDRLDEQLIKRMASYLREFHDGIVREELIPINYMAQLQLYDERVMSSSQIPDADKSTVSRALRAVKPFFEGEGSEVVGVHGDFNHSNVLVEPAYDNLGLIDFERTGLGFRSTDISRAAWRILDNDPQRIRLLLQEYYGNPDLTNEQLREFYALQAYDFLEAVAYFAYEGYQNNYPYYSSAIRSLQSWLMHI